MLASARDTEAISDSGNSLRFVTNTRVGKGEAPPGNQLTDVPGRTIMRH
jgi:hypothetical protein